MAINKKAYAEVMSELKDKSVTVVAVSKTKTVEDIFQLYELGQKDFGENYRQELLEKCLKLPSDIRWHFIGHLQTNKVWTIKSSKTSYFAIWLFESIFAAVLIHKVDKSFSQ